MTDQPPISADAPAASGSPPPPNPWYRPAMRDVLAAASTALIAAAFLIPLAMRGAAVDPDLKGAIILQWGLVMGYYFGTSKGSVAKDVTIAQMSGKGGPGQ